jgi:hypothetical protein
VNKPWKVALAFAVVFIAGGVTGGLVAVRVAPTFVQRRVFTEQFATTQIRVLTEALTLSPAQVEKIQPVVLATGEDLVRLRRDTSATFDKMHAGIMKELNPEQQAKHQEFLARMRDRRDRSKPHGAGDHPKPGDGLPPSAPKP